MDQKSEDPRSRAYAIVFLHRLGVIGYAKGRRELIASGIPELLVDSTLYAPTVRHLRMIVLGHIDPPKVPVFGDRPLRMTRIAA